MRRIPWIVCWLASLLGVWILSAHLERSRCGVRPTNASTGEVAPCRPTSPAVLVGRQHVHGSQARAKHRRTIARNKQVRLSMHQPASVDDDAAQVDRLSRWRRRQRTERRLVKAIETSSWFHFRSSDGLDGRWADAGLLQYVDRKRGGRTHPTVNVGLTLIPYLRRTNRMSWPRPRASLSQVWAGGASPWRRSPASCPSPTAPRSRVCGVGAVLLRSARALVARDSRRAGD